MNKSNIILNNKNLKIKSIVFDRRELSIKTINNYILNIDLNFNIDSLKNNARENISNRINNDQNFITKKYSYVIDIGNDVYLTKTNDYYLLEINIPKVDVLIPPFDNINNKRIDFNNNKEIEIKKLEAKIYFK